MGPLQRAGASPDKGKPAERRGRKAIGLRYCQGGRAAGNGGSVFLFPEGAGCTGDAGE